MKTAKSVKSLVKGRRTVMFKRQVPAKTVPSVAHFITTPYVRHKGSYLQVIENSATIFLLLKIVSEKSERKWK